jgi:hypothetical protein
MAFAGALSIFWQTFGLALFRSRYGGLINRNAQRTLPVKQTQVTMKEIVLAIAAFAVLFSCLRFASWSKVEFGAALVYWLLTYTLSYSFVVLVAIWAALYIRNFFLAIVGFLAISVSSLAAHHYYGKTWPGLAFSPEPEIWYFQVFFAGVLVFAAMRYCRGHRHALAR